MSDFSKVFFDLDGTLLDVSVRNHRVYCEVTDAFGGKPMDKATYWNLKRKKVVWPELLPMSGLSPDIEREYLAEFIKKIEAPEYLDLDTIIPGAVEVVQDVALEHHCYLVSLRRSHDNLVAQLGKLGLGQYFTKILSGHSDFDGYDRKIELIRGELGDSRGVIIGDTEADIITGKSLGMVAIALLSGIRDERFLEELEPDHLLGGITEVPAILAQY